MPKATLSLNIPTAKTAAETGAPSPDTFGIEVTITRGHERFNVVNELIGNPTGEGLVKNFEFDMPVSTTVRHGGIANK